MKEIKAYIHSNRIAAVIQALKESPRWIGEDAAGEHNLTVYKVQGSLQAIEDKERHYSVELGGEIINEYKLELICEDNEVDELVAIIAHEACTGQARAGWIIITEIYRGMPIS